jgi:hypothetical protein
MTGNSSDEPCGDGHFSQVRYLSDLDAVAARTIPSWIASLRDLTRIRAPYASGRGKPRQVVGRLLRLNSPRDQGGSAGVEKDYFQQRDWRCILPP